MESIKVRLCVGTHCTMMGAMHIYEIIQNMQLEYGQSQFTIELVKCFGDCKTGKAPVVVVNDTKITGATSEKVMETIMKVGRA